jgi:hypothetical protein
MKLLVAKFDTNKDHKISLEEFLTFCLSIPHVAWRAEKTRRRSSATGGDVRQPYWMLEHTFVCMPVSILSC